MDSNSGPNISIRMATAEESESAQLRENLHADVYEYLRGIHS